MSLTASFLTEAFVFDLSLFKAGPPKPGGASKGAPDAKVPASSFFSSVSLLLLAPADGGPETGAPEPFDEQDTLSSSMSPAAFLGLGAFRRCPETAHQARFAAINLTDRFPRNIRAPLLNKCVLQPLSQADQGLKALKATSATTTSSRTKFRFPNCTSRSTRPCTGISSLDAL